jgi:hypothetical protein
LKADFSCLSENPFLHYDSQELVEEFIKMPQRNGRDNLDLALVKTVRGLSRFKDLCGMECRYLRILKYHLLLFILCDRRVGGNYQNSSFTTEP